MNVDIRNAQLVTSETGFKVCGSVTLPTGQTFPFCTPEVEWKDAERELGRGIDNVRAESRRFWTRVKGWFK